MKGVRSQAKRETARSGRTAILYRQFTTHNLYYITNLLNPPSVLKAKQKENIKDERRGNAQIQNWKSGLVLMDDDFARMLASASTRMHACTHATSNIQWRPLLVLSVRLALALASQVGCVFFGGWGVLPGWRL